MKLSFHSIIAPALRAEGQGFSFNGQFRVNMDLGKSHRIARFEYRQYIKGTCSLQQGRFISSTPSRNTWRPAGPVINGAPFFLVPGGLQTNFTEDGEVRGGRVTRFGYRSNPATRSQGIEDYYSPSQHNGNKYTLMDTYGIRGAQRQSGLRIIYHLYWEGRIIDTSKNNIIIKKLNWDSSADDIFP